MIYVSATPGEYEKTDSKGQIAEQIIRPTGLIDPSITIFPVTATKEYKGQVKHFIDEALKKSKKGVVCL